MVKKIKQDEWRIIVTRISGPQNVWDSGIYLNGKRIQESAENTTKSKILKNIKELSVKLGAEIEIYNSPRVPEKKPKS